MYEQTFSHVCDGLRKKVASRQLLISSGTAAPLVAYLKQMSYIIRDLYRIAFTFD